jgi:hypothetical protein
MTPSFWKLTTTVQPRLRMAALGLTVGSVAAACTTALGLSDYVFRTTESEGGAQPAGARMEASGGSGEGETGTPARAEASTDASGDVTNCDVDLGSQCYPCAPAGAIQFLNACTSATCVPFDDLTRVTRLLPDGALPPLPVQDAGEG